MTALQSLPTLVAYGDSITQGHKLDERLRWTTMLQQRLDDQQPGRAPRVINAGVGGNTSAEGLARIDRDVLAHQPRLVLVEFGGNDATPEPARHVTPEAYARNLHTIHDRITTQAGRVVFVTFPPIINDWHAWRDNPAFQTPGGLDGCVETYRQITRDTAAALTCPLFDLDHLLRQAGQRDGQSTYILPDGVHLTPAGNELIARTLAAEVMGWLPARQGG